jgi:hypothetical protein
MKNRSRPIRLEDLLERRLIRDSISGFGTLDVLGYLQPLVSELYSDYVRRHPEEIPLPTKPPKNSKYMQATYF